MQFDRSILICLLLVTFQVNCLKIGSGGNGVTPSTRPHHLKKSAAALVISTSLLFGMSPLPVQVPAASAAEASKVNLPAKKEVKKGSITIEGEAGRIYRKALQCESDGDLIEAQNFFQQVVEVEPDFIYAWSNLGNVLTSRGNLNEALLCYKKAISLYPPRESLSAIVLNKASIEMALGRTDEAIKDLDAAERLAGPQPSILTTKAVALTNEGRWSDASTIFEKVISTADRNALPWWLRYSMALLETNRGTEAVAFFQRTLNRFPEEPEAKAFGAALYTALGAPVEGGRYWKSMIPQDRAMYIQPGFVSGKLKWGPLALKSWMSFQESKYAIVEK